MSAVAVKERVRLSDKPAPKKGRVKLTVVEPVEQKKKKAKVPKLSMKLSERALLVDLDIGTWSAKITDKEVSEEARNRRKAKRASGHFRKNLVARAALTDIGKAMTKLKAVHDRLTLPWSTNGMRILRSEAYEEWTKEIRWATNEFDQAADALAASFSSVQLQAKDFLGNMYRESDYPTPEFIRSKYYVKTEVMPVPEAGDFRAKLGNREVAILIRDLETRTRERAIEASRTIYEKISKVAEHMQERLTAYTPGLGPYTDTVTTGRFKDTLVSNVKELAELIPVLNIGDDPELTRLSERMLADLCQYKADDLRSDPVARKKTAKAAKAIFDKASEFIA